MIFRRIRSLIDQHVFFVPGIDDVEGDAQHEYDRQSDEQLQ
jgi:hypothetical protein